MLQNYPELIRESEYTAAMPALRQRLAELCVSETLNGYGGISLYTERYLRADAHANLLIVHGFTEFSDKYRELIHYFSQLGYNVFIYDHRGHGRSGREVENLRLVHVDRFEDYAADLKIVAEQLVIPNGSGLPIDIFSHSMGGTISIMALLEGLPIRKAVLSSPMVCPETKGVPRPIVLQELKHLIAKKGRLSKYPHMSEFNPDPNFERSPDISYARFRDNLDLRLRDPIFQSSAPTNQWILESLSAYKRFLPRLKKQPLQTKLLMLTAEFETVVKPRYQRKLAKLLQCENHLMQGGKHTLFTGSDEFLIEYYNLVFDFLMA